MPEIDKTYTFVALPPEERARIAVQKLEEMERAYFTAQVGLAIEKADLNKDDAEAVAAFDARRQQVLDEHKKKLKVASAIFNEVKITPPAQS